MGDGQKRLRTLDPLMPRPLGIDPYSSEIGHHQFLLGRPCKLQSRRRNLLLWRSCRNPDSIRAELGHPSFPECPTLDLPFLWRHPFSPCTLPSTRCLYQGFLGKLDSSKTRIGKQVQSSESCDSSRVAETIEPYRVLRVVGCLAQNRIRVIQLNAPLCLAP